MSTEVETKVLEDRIFELQEALGTAGKPSDLSDIVRDETRRLTEQIARFTPPQTGPVGKNAVTSDIASLFAAASPELIENVTGKNGDGPIDTFITTVKGDHVHLLWGKVVREEAELEKIHRANQNSRGRIPKRKASPKGVWAVPYIVPAPLRNKYIAKIQKRVGRMKAAWGETLFKLGVSRITSFVKRHIPTPFAVSETEGLMHGDCPSVRFGSRAIGVNRQRQIVNSAVRVRGQAMAKRIKLILSGYNRDLSRNMKIEAREKRSGKGGNYAIG